MYKTSWGKNFGFFSFFLPVRKNSKLFLFDFIKYLFTKTAVAKTLFLLCRKRETIVPKKPNFNPSRRQNSTTAMKEQLNRFSQEYFINSTTKTALSNTIDNGEGTGCCSKTNSGLSESVG